MAVTEHKIAGRVSYRVISSEKIEFTDGWDTRNLARVIVPQLVGMNVDGQKFSGKVTFFKAAIPQLLAAFAEIEARGLLPLILSYDGSYNPRPIRGSQNISNHALGLAIDINAEWNGLGRTPAPDGTKGSVIDLVAIFKKWGFGWGGDYRRRADGMHFEVVEIVNAGQGAAAPSGVAAPDAAPSASADKSVILVRGMKPVRVHVTENGVLNPSLVHDILDVAGVEIAKEGLWRDGTRALYLKDAAS